MHNNVSFKKLRRALTRDLNFEERVHGSHHLFKKEGTDLLIALQAVGADEVKPYQLKQVERALIERGVLSETEWRVLVRKLER